MKGKAGRVYSLTPKGKKAFDVWSKHLEQVKQELQSDCVEAIRSKTE